MSVAARVQAQAKINLVLRILPVLDPDGYHFLHTIFHRIDLADEVRIQLAGTARSLDSSGPALPASGLGPVEKNLAYRAAVAYLARNGDGLPTGFSIEIEKRIPVGGGLGGGSADAAAVLRALQALSPNRLSADALHEVAASLGSDVPFLATELVTALGGERGDSLIQLPYELPPADVLLVVPRFAIPTADAYRWLDEDRGPDCELPPDLSPRGLKELRGWDFYADDENDFEPVIERRFPKIREYREALKSNGATVARMSGSGSTVFGIFESGSPPPERLGLDTTVLRTRTSDRVVQVEILQ